MLYEEISHHSTLCEEVCSVPSPAILFEFLHTPSSLFPLYWKKQWTINVYSLSAFHSQYYRPLSIQPSVVSFSNRKILIFSVAPFTKGVPHIRSFLRPFPAPFPSLQHTFWEEAVSDLYSGILTMSALVLITFQSFLIRSFLSNHYWADVFTEIFIIIWKSDSYMTLSWKTIIA